LVDQHRRESTRRVPKASQSRRYDAFADQVFETARAYDKVHVVGLSGGGMVALRMAERHGQERGNDGQPILQNVVAVSPYLRPALRTKIRPL
jgi:pimeloyl-ACP methyl ester carboxylesterase